MNPVLLLIQVALLFVLAKETDVDAHILRLQFDGSHRPPGDPSFPTSSLGLIGTAAACLVVKNSSCGRQIGHDYLEDDKNVFDTTMWLGGKAMSRASNSAEAEYEGLLLGLEKAVSLLQDGQLSPTIRKIAIQGDCKTVIDQLRGTSRPRKLASQYHRALSCLRQLQDNQGIPEVDFCHIPREENKLCDGICGVIRSEIVEQGAWQSALQCIQDLRPMTDDASVLSRCIGLHNNKSLIAYSKRPYLYQQLTQKARDAGHHQTLVDVGEQMELEAKAIWSKVTSRRKDGKRLQAYGIGLQIEGLQGLATRKSLKVAIAKERKNRFLLENYSAHPPSVDAPFFSTLPSPASCSADEGELAYLWQTWLDSARASDKWGQEQSHWVSVPVRGRFQAL